MRINPARQPSLSVYSRGQYARNRVGRKGADAQARVNMRALLRRAAASL